MNKRRDKQMRTATYVAAALLLVALATLGHNMSLAAQLEGVDSDERYPDLYVENSGYYQAPDAPTIYFTFDDGPSQNTEEILDVLVRENIKATFFVTAQYEDQEYAIKLLQRMRDEGHTIGLHTYTHEYSIYRSLENYLDDLDRINDFVIEATGVKTNILRFPGGSRTSNCDPELMKRIATEVTRRGYIYYDWTVVSDDAGATPTPVEKLTANILDGLQNRQVEILLFHDNSIPTTTPKAVEELIRTLREQGYAFDHITDTTPPVQLLNLAA